MKPAGAEGASLREETKSLNPFVDRLAFIYATWFGLGLAPRAPGTIGTLGALPLFFLLHQLPAPLHAALVVLVTLLGMASANRVAARLGQKDPQIVVIDEVAGVLIALFLGGAGTWQTIAAAVIAFRILDIFKPGPIAQAEKMKPAGIGIMADDVLAGCLAGALVFTGSALVRGFTV